MDLALSNIYEIIDNLDADDTIKSFYKDLIVFELKNKSERYIEKYEQLINYYVRDFE